MLALIALQLGSSLNWYPAYHTFYNALSGGLAGATARGQAYHLLGQRAVVDFLAQQIFPAELPIYAAVGGDSAALGYSYRRFHQPQGDPRLKFAAYRPEQADYLVVFPAHARLINQQRWEETLRQPPLFTFNFKGVRQAEVFAAHYPDYRQPRRLSVNHAFRHTGRLDRRTRVVTLNAGQDRRGFALFDIGYRVAPGLYNLSLPVLLIDEPEAQLTDRDTGSAPEAAVLRIRLGPDCLRELSRRELLPGQWVPVELSCPVAAAQRLVPQVEWLGEVSVQLTAWEFWAGEGTVKALAPQKK